MSKVPFNTLQYQNLRGLSNDTSIPNNYLWVIFFQVLLNIPSGIYQVRFDFNYYGNPGMKGALYNVTLDKEVCQNKCRYLHLISICVLEKVTTTS